MESGRSADDVPISIPALFGYSPAMFTRGESPASFWIILIPSASEKPQYIVCVCIFYTYIYIYIYLYIYIYIHIKYLKKKNVKICEP